MENSVLELLILIFQLSKKLEIFSRPNSNVLLSSLISLHGASQKSAVSSAYIAKWQLFIDGTSLMKTLNKNGERSDPWGTPAGTVNKLESCLSTVTKDLQRTF